MEIWSQVYNPFGSAALSTIAAAIPVVTLLALIASGKVQAHMRRLSGDQAAFRTPPEAVSGVSVPLSTS